MENISENLIDETRDTCQEHLREILTQTLSLTPREQAFILHGNTIAFSLNDIDNIVHNFLTYLAEIDTYKDYSDFYEQVREIYFYLYPEIEPDFEI